MLIRAASGDRVLRRAGIVGKVIERGFFVRNMAWRNLAGQVITGINDMDTLDIPDRMCAYPLNLLAELIIEELVEMPNVKIHWSHRVVNVSQNEEQAWLEIDHLNGQQIMYADFVVGCDGARSGVRKALLGKEFSGYTWDRQIVTTNVRFAF